MPYFIMQDSRLWRQKRVPTLASEFEEVGRAVDAQQLAEVIARSLH